MTRAAHTGVDRAGSMFRVYMGGNAIITWFIGMTDVRSLMHVVTETQQGAALVWILMLLGAAALLDAMVNDFMPERFHWRGALRHRHYILSAMAFCHIAQLYVGFYQIRSPGLSLYHLWSAVTIMLVAFIDAHQRSKDAQCSTVCN